MEKDAEAQRAERRVHLSQSFDRMWLLDGVLAPSAGRWWPTALRRMEDELFRAEWAEHEGAVRTPAQRRADALVGYETFAGRVCQLAGGTVLTPGSRLPWLSEAYVERVVFDGPDRVKNVGVRRRLFHGATRRAVEVRDKECFSEFCDEPAAWCEIDHVQPHGRDGLTVDANGRPACPYHHHRRRDGPP